MLEAAKDTIELQARITRNEWWDDECKEAIKEKNMARGKCLQRRTRATQEEYEKKYIQQQTYAEIRRNNGE